MPRLLLYVGVALVLLLGLAATIGVLAYGNEPTRDGRLEVEGLSGPVTVAWSDSGQLWIEADTEADLAAGLGYAHAADYGWAVMFWRQAARGTLAEWFGDDVRPLDLHARTLGLADLARRTYEALPEADRTLLDAYARGVNRAFEEPGVAQGDAFIVADVVPGPWEPWDALAVERLHLYLGAPPLLGDTTWRAARADSAVARFVEADSTFRAFLGMSQTGYDRVYAIGSGADRTLVRHVAAGRSALPLLAPAVLRLGGTEAVVETVPGTLLSPSGWSGGLGWGILLGAPVALEPFAGEAPPRVFSRIVERDGDETLLSVARDSSGLVLRAGQPRPEADSAQVAGPDSAGTASGTGWRVRWRGFRLGTDLDASRSLRAGRVPSAGGLLGGDGLAVTASDTRVLGSPTVAVSGPGYALVARDTLARQAARLLVRQDSGAATARVRIKGTASVWARRYVSDLLDGLGARDSVPDILQVPYSYLLGWNGAYDPEAIAPSVFEHWLTAHRDLTGHLPDPADSLDAALLPYTLRIARAELRDRYGSLPYNWRWGDLQGAPAYPLLGERQTAAARSFRRPLGPPGGHPTSLLPGPSLVFEDEVPGLAVWSVWTRLGDGRTTVRTPGMRPPPSGVLDPTTDTGGTSLVLTPRVPVPGRRLLLVPPA